MHLLPLFSHLGVVCCFPELHSCNEETRKVSQKRIFAAFPCVISIYYLVSVFSYAAYGTALYADEYNGNVSMNLPKNFGQSAISVAIVVHVLCAYIVYMNPFFREIEIAYNMDEANNAFP